MLVLFWFVLVFLRRHCCQCPGCRRLTWVYMFLSRWCSLSLLPPPMRLCIGREGRVYTPKSSSALGVDGFVTVLAMCHILGVGSCVA